MKICKGTVLLKRLLAEVVLYQHETRNFIKKNSNVLPKNICKLPLILDV